MNISADLTNSLDSSTALGHSSNNVGPNDNSHSILNEIYSYSDYRDFILDFYKYKKSKNKNFSLAYFSGKVGQSKMAIKYLIDKQRHIADENIDAFSKALGLNDSESKYFRNLVLFNKAKSVNEKNRYFESMLKQKKSPFFELFLNQSSAAIFKAWYYPAIAELSYTDGFQEDPEWIKRKLAFNVSVENISKALNYLRENGFLKNSTSIISKIKLPENIESYIYSKYSADQLDLSKQAIESQNKEDREIFNITISIDEKKFEMAKDMIKKFRHTLHDILANDEPADRVVQINMQLFTLATNKTEKNENSCEKLNKGELLQ